MNTTIDVPGAGTGGFLDARPGVAAFMDLMTAALEAVMVGSSCIAFDSTKSVCKGEMAKWLVSAPFS
jgi:hypothetical protein